jgi:acyl-CoA thioesterase
VQGPGQYPPLFPAGAGPGFARQFEVRQAAGPSLLSGADEGDICAWVRHKDRAADDTLVGLVALADALPPAAMTMFDKRAAISTMTWHLDLLTDNPQTDDGWWLCRSTTETALDGYSTQRMAIWNAAGEAVIRGRQNIAIFF